MIKERDTFVDIAKGIAMLMIVRIHTEVFSVINAPYPIVAVPLFFFMSGFYDNTNKPFLQWFPKTFKSLFLTAVIWVFICFVYLSILHYIKDRTIPFEFSIESPLPAGGVTWFLFALFYAKLGMYLIHQIKLPQYLLFLLVFLLASISHINLPFLFDEGLAALPFYYLGSILYPYIKRTNGGHVLLAVLGGVCLLFMPMKCFPWVLVPWQMQSSLLMYPVCFIMTVLSFFTFLKISYCLAGFKWLANYGKQTLGILVLHPLFCHTCAITLNRFLVIGSTGWIILFLFAYIIICVFSYYLTLFINKHQPFLFGKF